MCAGSTLSHYKVTFIGSPLWRTARWGRRIKEAIHGSYGKVIELTKGARRQRAHRRRTLYMTAENVGDQNVKGEGAHVKMTDVLPPGLEALGVAGSEPFKEGNFKAREPIPCSLEEKGGVQSASCTLSKALAPDDQIEMRINVKLKAGAHTGELNQLERLRRRRAPEAHRASDHSSLKRPCPSALKAMKWALKKKAAPPPRRPARTPSS